MGEINPFPGPHNLLRIPNKMVGLIIGKNGETVKTIHQKTGCYIFIPKDSKPGEDYRELELSGPEQSVEICKREIISMIHMALYGRLPYQNSLFYPYIDPTTGLPIIDPGIMAQLDPNTLKSENGNGDNADNNNNNNNDNDNNKNNEDDKDFENVDNKKNEKNEIDENGNFIIKENNYAENNNKNNIGNKQTEKVESLNNINELNTLNTQDPYDLYNNNSEYYNINSFSLHNNTNNTNNNKQSQIKMEELEYKYAPIDINANYVQNNYFNPFDSNNYNLGNYNDQSNYDLYYQSLYQMYPQMSDYYKKSKENEMNNISNSNNIEQQNPQNHNKAFVLFNTNLLEDNVMYDPSKIDTNILDVNFQNKINFSAYQYFEGKMFDQNYSMDNNNNNNEINNKDEIEIENNNNNNNIINNDKSSSDKNNNNNNSVAKFEVPNVPEKKRKSRFDN